MIIFGTVTIGLIVEAERNGEFIKLRIQVDNGFKIIECQSPLAPERAVGEIVQVIDVEPNDNQPIQTIIFFKV